MSHLLPPQGHPARDMFDVQSLVDIAEGRVPVPAQRFAVRRSAERFLAANPAARRVVSFYLNGSNDQLELVSVGPRGGWKREWVFGPIGRNARLA